jgi:hypothetical protein
MYKFNSGIRALRASQIQPLYQRGIPLQQAIIENPASEKQSTTSARRTSKNGTVAELETELGIWLSAVESFIGTAGHPFADKMNLRGHDWNGDLQVVSSGLHHSAGILSKLTSSALSGGGSPNLSIDELDALSDVVNDVLTVAEGFSRAKPIGFSEWRAFCRIAALTFNSTPAYEKIVRVAVRVAESTVPEKLRALIESKALPFGDRFDLGVIVPGFTRILRWLRVVERMLEDDQPLKSGLLIFARVHEDTLDLVGHINRRLQRFGDEDAELFRALDSASYIASIELRKVFDQELAGLVTVRSAITVFARTETAFASLRDNIHQILAGIARLIDARVEPSDIFPAIGVKLEASLKLRSELAAMAKKVRACEHDALSKGIAESELRSFVEGPVRSLFYKDRESVERFVEEISRSHDRKDLVPILHRFGAYLETLFGHVNNRAVLRDHPFEL